MLKLMVWKGTFRVGMSFGAPDDWLLVFVPLYRRAPDTNSLLLKFTSILMDLPDLIIHQPTNNLGRI